MATNRTRTIEDALIDRTPEPFAPGVNTQLRKAPRVPREYYEDADIEPTAEEKTTFGGLMLASMLYDWHFIQENPQMEETGILESFSPEISSRPLSIEEEIEFNEAYDPGEVFERRKSEFEQAKENYGGWSWIPNILASSISPEIIAGGALGSIATAATGLTKGAVIGALRSGAIKEAGAAFAKNRAIDAIQGVGFGIPIALNRAWTGEDELSDIPSTIAEVTAGNVVAAPLLRGAFALCESFYNQALIPLCKGAGKAAGATYKKASQTFKNWMWSPTETQGSYTTAEAASALKKEVFCDPLVFKKFGSMFGLSKVAAKQYPIGRALTSERDEVRALGSLMLDSGYNTRTEANISVNSYMNIWKKPVFDMKNSASKNMKAWTKRTGETKADFLKQTRFWILYDGIEGEAPSAEIKAVVSEYRATHAKLAKEAAEVGLEYPSTITASDGSVEYWSQRNYDVEKIWNNEVGFVNAVANVVQKYGGIQEKADAQKFAFYFKEKVLGLTSDGDASLGRVRREIEKSFGDILNAAPELAGKLAEDIGLDYNLISKVSRAFFHAPTNSGKARVRNFPTKPFLDWLDNSIDSIFDPFLQSAYRIGERRALNQAENFFLRSAEERAVLVKEASGEALNETEKALAETAKSKRFETWSAAVKYATRTTEEEINSGISYKPKRAEEELLESMPNLVKCQFSDRAAEQIGSSGVRPYFNILMDSVQSFMRMTHLGKILNATITDSANHAQFGTRSYAKGMGNFFTKFQLREKIKSADLKTLEELGVYCQSAIGNSKFMFQDVALNYKTGRAESFARKKIDASIKGIHKAIKWSEKKFFTFTGMDAADRNQINAASISHLSDIIHISLNPSKNIPKSFFTNLRPGMMDRIGEMIRRHADKDNKFILNFDAWEDREAYLSLAYECQKRARAIIPTPGPADKMKILSADRIPANSIMLYSSFNQAFVNQILLPMLERGANPFLKWLAFVGAHGVLEEYVRGWREGDPYSLDDPVLYSRGIGRVPIFGKILSGIVKVTADGARRDSRTYFKDYDAFSWMDVCGLGDLAKGGVIPSAIGTIKKLSQGMTTASGKMTIESMKRFAGALPFNGIPGVNEGLNWIVWPLAEESGIRRGRKTNLERAERNRDI